ncbi:hypothetical protein PPL_03602 [Heterostelium album PN500]|uniref:F-box domain-containing protein n=1 Tax=Heterostelium pallidum (strain ATCC 26659 / Pp 5 / PN500) TaxID=670386 RepID=D3B589_HETP5|nr:hypothetical protein PPL_03602 [Heterostelium album PN500]EFA83454.1 hypothetical protein PPL_03602 [Heterostelium album PN500]|eukprot:XP_020435571.1 hypothetical protein PPL_03602 [Heterostelium album PN500]
MVKNNNYKDIRNSPLQLSSQNNNIISPKLISSSSTSPPSKIDSNNNDINIQILPIEILYNILVNLNLFDIKSLLVSNRYFYSLVNQEKIIWKNLFFQYFKSSQRVKDFNMYNNNNNSSNNNVGGGGGSSPDCLFYNKKNIISSQNVSPPVNNNKPLNWKMKFKKYHDINRNWCTGNYESKSIEGHSGGVFTLSFKDNLMLTGSFDKLVRIWDRKNMVRIGSIMGHAGWIWSVLLERSKSTHALIGMSSSQDSTINITNLTQISSKLHNQHHHESLEESANNNIDSSIKITNKCKSTISPMIRLNGHVGTVWTIEPEKDLQHFFSGGSDCLIKYWSIDSKESYNVGRHQDVVLCLSIINDKLLASGSADNTVRLWDRRSVGHPLMTLQGHGGFVNTIDNKGNYIVTGCDDKLIRIFDIRNGMCVDTLNSHTDAVRTLKIKGERMVSGSSDMVIKVWDTNNYNKPRLSLKGHTGSIVSLQFDNKKIISGSLDSTIKTWNFNIKKSGRHSSCSEHENKNKISSPINYIRYPFQSPKI